MATVAIVDSDARFAGAIHRLLSSHGYVAQTTNRYDEGLEFLIRTRADLALVELKVPKSGLSQMLNRIRSDPRTSRIPVIALAKQRTFNVMRSAMNMGADDYVPKGVKPEVLLKAIETRLHRNRIHAERAEALQRALCMALPHELRTAVHGVLGASQLLVEDGVNSDPAEVRAVGKLLHISARRLGRSIDKQVLLRHLITLSPDQCERDSHSKEIGDLIRRTAMHIAAKYQRDEDLRLQLELTTCNIPAVHFSTIVEELVDNAFKFSERGTVVEIAATESIDERFRFCVTDLGWGLTRHDLALVGPFVQFERSDKEQQGIGTGLALVYEIARLYRLDIDLCSEPNHGTTCTLIA